MEEQTAKIILLFISSETIVLKPATGKGYEFVGWFRDKARKNRVTEIPKGSIGDITLYAKWNPKRYRIVFSGNGATGGKGSTKTMVCQYGKKYTLPMTGFVRPEYAAVTWNTKPDGSGKKYFMLSQISNLSSQNGGAVRLYAELYRTAAYTGYGAGEGIVIAAPEDSIRDAIDSLVYEYTDLALSSEFSKVGAAVVYDENSNTFCCVFEFSN
ncbi:MAG: InlB B-repeat-containing protein [Eubacteriales bacterium]|nr:InlB B-repeat-containing protein [Eubacteriales bacterium]